MIFTFDLETLPCTDPEMQKEIIASMKPPANYKNPEAIQKWIDENKDEAIAKTSFDGCFGRMFCVGYQVDEEETQVIGGNNEVANLKEFAYVLKQVPQHQRQMMRVVGHYIVGFDLRFLFQRYVINGVKPPELPWNAKPWDARVHDNMVVFAGDKGSISQDKLAKALGLKGKSSMSGAEVYPAWLEGRYQEIMDYCKDDVAQAYQIYKRLAFVDAI